MKDCLLSADDSPLHSIWEEICVQQLRELSYIWRTYEETITASAKGQIEGLQPTR